MTVTHHIARQKFPLLNLRRVAGNIGSEVNGITLSANIPDDFFAQIEAALVKYKARFFRNQSSVIRLVTVEDDRAIAAAERTPARNPARSWSPEPGEFINHNKGRG